MCSDGIALVLNDIKLYQTITLKVIGIYVTKSSNRLEPELTKTVVANMW